MPIILCDDRYCRYGTLVLPRRSSLMLALVLIAAPARADCLGSVSLAGCFSVLGATGPAEPGPFRTLSLGHTLPAEAFAISANTWYVVRPAELVASSPDPLGRTIEVVSRATVVDLRATIGLGRRLDFTLAAPTFYDIRGIGSDAIASQKPTPLQGTAVGDPRVGMRASLLPQSMQPWRLMIRNEWSLPFGNNPSYAGERDATSTLAATGAVYYNGWSASVELGVKSAKPVRFGDVRLGTEALFGLGFARDILLNNVLTIGAEAWARPVLIAAPTDTPSSTHITVIPAEWLLSAQFYPKPFPAWLWLGGGGALPLSSRETTDSLRVATHFIAPSSARVRLGFGLGLMLDSPSRH